MPTHSLAFNKKASFNFTLLERYEAGLVLLGSEVKALRLRGVSLQESFVALKEGELFLYNVNIPKYPYSTSFNHEPVRPRKLLLHRRQIKKLIGLLKRRGFSLVPTHLYFNRKGKAKVEIALAEGKSLVDKRSVIKEREWNRDKARIFRNI